MAPKCMHFSLLIVLKPKVEQYTNGTSNESQLYYNVLTYITGQWVVGNDVGTEWRAPRTRPLRSFVLLAQTQTHTQTTW